MHRPSFLGERGEGQIRGNDTFLDYGWWMAPKESRTFHVRHDFFARDGEHRCRVGFRPLWKRACPPSPSPSLSPRLFAKCNWFLSLYVSFIARYVARCLWKRRNFLITISSIWCNLIFRWYFTSNRFGIWYGCCRFTYASVSIFVLFLRQNLRKYYWILFCRY